MAKETRTIRNFEEARRWGDGSLLKYARAAKKVVHEGLMAAFNSQMVECKVKVDVLHNGTLRVEVREGSTKAQKEYRSFSLHFSMHGKAIRNFVYYGPVLKQERVLSYVAANRDVSLSVGAFTKKMKLRKDKIREFAEMQKEISIKIGQHDNNVAAALEIFARDTVQTLYKKAVFKA